MVIRAQHLIVIRHAQSRAPQQRYYLTHESVHGLVAVILQPRDFASLHLLRCSRLTLGWHAVGIALPIVIPLRRSTRLLNHGPLPLLSRPLLLFHDQRVSMQLLPE